MFCSVYFYLKPNEKAAGSASYGEEGTHSTYTHSSQNLLSICWINTEIQTPEPLLQDEHQHFSPLHHSYVKCGACQQMVIPPLQQDKGDFNRTQSQSSGLTPFHLLQVKSSGAASAEATNEDREFYSNCRFHRKFRLTAKQPCSLKSLQCLS